MVLLLRSGTETECRAERRISLSRLKNRFMRSMHA